ncbi:redoxin domain-containing protein [bacterium]|nr:redoxin domain-containing protein [bacterium]
MRSLLVFVLLLFPLVLNAQPGPVAGSDFTVVYNPPASSPFASASAVTLVYVFDYWNVRYGTRLALWQNVLDPDTSRTHYAPMKKEGESWTAKIPIPATAALLSYVVTDGEHVDGNNQKTWVRYVLGADGEPVKNARFYNLSFLELAREKIGVQIREAEREVTSYPENFPAYQQYFMLLMEQAKGSPRTQERIAARIDGLEEQYGTNPEFLNMAAEVWYYVLQDQRKGLEYRKRIEGSKMWPQVFAMADRQSKQETAAERAKYHVDRRKELQGAELPAFNLNNGTGGKSAFPRNNGRPLIMLFWASTSDKSGSMLEALRAALAPYPADAVDVVVVSVDQDEEKALKAYQEKRMPFELLFNQGSTLYMLGVDSIPITYFVDTKNIVQNIVVGFDSGISGRLRKLVDGLMR